MSVKIMNMVFERYPNGGGEMLLALSLADHSHDDGTNIYPSIAHLATKTRQSPRAVQYQLRRMEESGWLQLANVGDGGRGKHRAYRIAEAWIKGADFAPLPEKGADSAPIEKGATDDAKGATGDTKGASHDTKGCKAFAPASNHQEPSKEPKKAPLPAIAVSLLTLADLTSEGVSAEAAAEFMALRKRKKAPLTPLAWDGLKSEVVKAGWTIDAAVRKCIQRNWQGFEAAWVADEQPKGGPGGRAGGGQRPETPFQRSQREKADAWSGGVAGAKPAAGALPAIDFIDMEAT